MGISQPAQTAYKQGTVHQLQKPYLLFIGDIADKLTAKTAFGLRDWRRDDLVGQWRLVQSAVDLGLPELGPKAAIAAGARSVVIGAAPAGGQLPTPWIGALETAVAAGLDIVSGLHQKLTDIPRLVQAARTSGATLHDIRRPPLELSVGTGVKRTGKRLLTVGTDCAIGKKYTALAIARDMARRGIASDFRATGQTGILIAGAGVPIDAVVSDFISGAAEALSPNADPHHWDVIEGQGSLFHPSYAGVALGLLHGSQPDALVLCTDPGRTEIDGCPGFVLPDPAAAMRRYLDAAHLTNSQARFVGIALNTATLADSGARSLLESWSKAFGLPCVDPYRFGAAEIVDLLE